MKVLIVDSYYPRFLRNAVNTTQFLEATDYAAFHEKLIGLKFGTSDFYSRHLKTLGHSAKEIIFNSEPAQTLWAAENGFGYLSRTISLRKKFAARFPKLGGIFANKDYLTEVCVRQIRDYRPDVLYLQDLNMLSPQVLAQLKRSKAVRLIAGQIASPLPSDEFLAAYDVIFSSFPHYVERLRARGLGAEYFRLGFEPDILELLPSEARDSECTFVGGFSPAHDERMEFLSHLVRDIRNLQFYGYGAETLPVDSPIKARHFGEAWALEMYRVLRRSRITLNIHIGVAENNANNMRLYEATGCGAMLLTDAKSNLHELFEVGKEVETYSSLQEAKDKLRYYVLHPAEAAKIAAAGQRRTLKDHTYASRMKELAPMLEAHLAYQ